jgi:hypothetical protein
VKRTPCTIIDSEIELGVKYGIYNKLIFFVMIRKLTSGKYRIYSRKINPKTGKRRNLGTFDTLEEAKKHEREIEYFKHH